MPPSKRAAVYVLLCADGTWYTGATTNLARRVRAHQTGTAAKYTRGRRPVRLLAWWFVRDYALACSHEARFKRLARAAKRVALEGDEAFGASLHKPPLTVESPTKEQSMSFSRPEPDELAGYVERARTSRVRIATEHGDILFTFFPDDAPMHTAAFMKLTEAGFYDGLTFHRVEPGFVVQGGDPDGNGTGGPGYRLNAEFNSRPHVRGTVAMARSSNPDSAGSQFYLCLDDARFLDNQYTVFGQMIDGFEALDAIRRGDVMQRVTVEST